MTALASPHASPSAISTALRGSNERDYKPSVQHGPRRRQTSLKEWYQ